MRSFRIFSLRFTTNRWTGKQRRTWKRYHSRTGNRPIPKPKLTISNTDKHDPSLVLYITNTLLHKRTHSHTYAIKRRKRERGWKRLSFSRNNSTHAISVFTSSFITHSKRSSLSPYTFAPTSPSLLFYCRHLNGTFLFLLIPRTVYFPFVSLYSNFIKHTF